MNTPLDGQIWGAVIKYYYGRPIYIFAIKSSAQQIISITIAVPTDWDAPVTRCGFIHWPFLCAFHWAVIRNKVKTLTISKWSTVEFNWMGKMCMNQAYLTACNHLTIPITKYFFLTDSIHRINCVSPYEAK